MALLLQIKKGCNERAPCTSKSTNDFTPIAKDGIIMGYCQVLNPLPPVLDRPSLTFLNAGGTQIIISEANAIYK